MTLPPNFGHWEHLHDMLRRDHNKLVAHYFRDLGANWEPEISTNRGAQFMGRKLQSKDIDQLQMFGFAIAISTFMELVNLYF